MRAVGQVELFFGKSEEMALIHSVFGATCQFDSLCCVPSIIALFGHDQSTELKTELANTVSFPAS
jgi:hypothetical protein